MSQSTITTKYTAATNQVIAAEPVTISELHIKNVTAAAKTVQLHNATSLPADTAVPVVGWDIASSGELVIKFTNPIHFDTGLVVASSTTSATLTISATADLIVAAVITTPHG